MAAPRLLRSSREDGKRGYDLWSPAEGVEDLYVDGFAGMAITGSVLRVGLFISSMERPTDEAEEGVEHRLLQARLIMPIENFVEMSHAVLGNIAQNREGLETALKERTEKLLSISVVSSPDESEKSNG